MSKRDHRQDLVPGGEGVVQEDVPFVHQNHINLCGDASAQMLAMYNQRLLIIGMKQNVGHENSYRLRRNPRGVFQGRNGDRIARMLEGVGLQARLICPRDRWTAALVRAALETYGPYAQAVGPLHHWVVVTGTDGESVIYHDPWRGRNKSKPMGQWVIFAHASVGSAVTATEQGYVQTPDGIQEDMPDPA
jgi:hypothetical protein